MPTFENFERESTTDFRGVLNRVRSQAGINQIRGTNVAGSTGSGIPQHVTNVSASMANASTGSTSTITVTFSRNPADSAFGGVKVFVKGYQSNQSPTQVASSADSPVTFILNNTSEALSIAVQAFGNGGTAPLTTAPTVGVTLPKSTSGGVGTKTVTSGSATSGTAVAGQLAKFASPATTLTGADLTGDVVTSGTVATTVQKIQGVTVATTTPKICDIFEFGADGKWDVNSPRMAFRGAKKSGNSTSISSQGVYGITGSSLTGSAANTQITPTATEPAQMQYQTGAGASTTSFGCSETVASNGIGGTMGLLKRFSFRMGAKNTTNVRYWFGLANLASSLPSVAGALSTDTPALNYVAFRFSSTTDTHWKGVTATDATHQTVVDTGISVDTTNSQLFDVTWDGTTIQFYINGVSVGSSITNLPATSTVFYMFYSLDNKNTANNGSLNWAHYFVWEVM